LTFVLLKAPGMRVRRIEVFNAVMLAGSVKGAARLINVTHPALSHTLQRAELP
jgi:DNA-binding transcriptional LysR family regulator